jgi:hypothetical protein
MNKIRLTHLTMVGSAVEKASIEFSSGLTLVYGASDTGKSYIAQAIDFMLGAKKLKQSVPEAVGYTHVLLGMVLPDGRELTLIRSVSGGKYNAYFSDVRELPRRPADEQLSPRHSSRSPNNLSNFLLRQLGVEGALIRKNARNECLPLSFRNLAHICIINETAMQAEVSPTLTGQYTNRTAEKSVFRFLVDGVDDSDLAGTAESADQRKVSKGKAELLERLIGDLRSTATQFSDVKELRSRHIRVRSTLEERSSSVSQILARRDALISQRDAALNSREKDRARLAEVQTLLGRFSLLGEQYTSDIARLEMVAEAGTLLGYFERGVCVFCGAALEDQKAPDAHMAAETTELAIAVNAERVKVEALRSDLGTTLSDVQEQMLDLGASLEVTSAAISELDVELAQLENELLPERELLSQLVEARSKIEQDIMTIEQIDKLEALKAELTPGESAEEDLADEPTTASISRLSQTIAALLQRWQVPDAEPVHFDHDDFDLIVAGQPRSSRGKGIRAILHAAYSLGLADYCEQMQHPHPGFVVLDSPLITYRGPDVQLKIDDLDSTTEEHVSGSVANAFFRYLASSYSGQVIVLENTDPPGEIASDPAVIRFTKSRDVGRYGFFPG